MNKEILLIRILFCFLFLRLIHCQLHINLYLTEWVSNDTNNNDLQHDCLHVLTLDDQSCSQGYLISYCMGEWPSKWNIQENNFDRKYTFDQLSKRNISSEQLYLWSAPMDTVENYQFYLNQLPDSAETSMATQIFYNCTLPNFGSKCQYTLNNYKPHHLTLTELIHDFYCWNGYEPATLTCYIHLQCNHGPSPSCLDWTEICDGKVDCLDGGKDEEYCWKLEINECNENEYRCSNGQCIPQIYFNDRNCFYNCLDRSDELNRPYPYMIRSYDTCLISEPTFLSEDVSCIRLFDTQWNILTSSCIPNRVTLLFQALFSAKPKSLSDECWTAFKCIIEVPVPESQFCKDFCFDGTCDKIVLTTCPGMIYASTVPIFLGHVFLVYKNNNIKYGSNEVIKSIYICYNDQRLYFPDENKTRLLLNNNTCHTYISSADPSVIYPIEWIVESMININAMLTTLTSWIYNDSIYCNHSTMYQCINSYKCISKHRLFDTFPDCFYKDDEYIGLLDKNCSTKQNSKFFKCETTNECIPLRLVGDKICHCTIYEDYICDDEYPEYHSDRTEISFYRICDNFTHLYPMMIDDQNRTDETECDQWPCNNIYTRCNSFWNCLNGADELNCYSTALLNCPSNNHICISFETKKPMCLPIEKANDGIVDCIGAADEPTLCRVTEYSNPFETFTFYCKNQNSSSCLPVRYLCDTTSQCTNKEDEVSCTDNDFKKYQMFASICGGNYKSDGSDIAKTLCQVFYMNDWIYKKKYFKLSETQSSSTVNITHLSSRIFSRKSITQTVQYYQQRCHRGLDMQVWLNKEKNLTKNVCLCPPSFYGDTCQYQNQRISLTVEFRTKSDSGRMPFIIIVSLIDNSEERIIHSYEQFTVLLDIDCRRKFHAYLLYSSRPKNQTKVYLIHIDIFEKLSLKYRGSVIKPLLFPFLPVHRLSFLLDIPDEDENSDSCSDRQCINGKCRRYYTDPNNTTFCQCNPGWSGQYCTIQHTCTCSLDSLCIGILANHRSLCVCPLNKIGDRCLFNSTLCKIDPDKKCLNGGQCMFFNQYRTSDRQFICICPTGYIGDRCEINQTKIVVSFDKNIVLSSSIYIHFIGENMDSIPHRLTIFKTIPFGQNSITIYWSFVFSIIFIELIPKNYYLTLLVRKQSPISTPIEITLYPSNRCLHIDELFNKTILSYHRIRRIKYYHIPCQRDTLRRLSCFYDDIHLCLCQDHDRQRVANCFEFNHTLKMNCFGRSSCQNGGECFADDVWCPRTTLCLCPMCFYGTRCHLSTNGFSLSLDAILGYHIRPNINISAQPAAVLVSLILSVIMTIAGLINGVVTLMTFQNKKVRDVGCGIYLLWLSINNLSTMIIFSLKIWILVLSHMGSINNRLFLKIQCFSLDFLLRFVLNMDQWLTTCVAIERTYITIKGIKLNKKKTRFTAKLVIIGLVLLVIGTSIHDPVNRRLFDEAINGDEEKRIWCIVNFSSTIRIFNLVMAIFHIIAPFIINLISAIIIITKSARQRAIIKKQEKYQKILIEQFHEHKNLLVSPIVLTILVIPRLIIAFASGCMQSMSNSWLFLVGYFISLFPSLLTFILFVLPSSIYYEVFQKTARKYKNIIRRRRS